VISITAVQALTIKTNIGSFLMVNAAVAQSVEQWTENPCVISSILIGGNRYHLILVMRWFFFASIVFRLGLRGNQRRHRVGPDAVPSKHEVIAVRDDIPSPWTVESLSAKDLTGAFFFAVFFGLIFLSGCE
jgi:hypothetical protein